MCLYHQHILTFIVVIISWTSAEFHRDLEMGCYTINVFKHIRLMITMMEYNSVFKFHEVSDDYENI
jgi:hypothetical protein